MPQGKAFKTKDGSACYGLEFAECWSAPFTGLSVEYGTAS